MFSVLSRFTKPGDGKKVNTPMPMSSSLQKKFSRGVDYNMKILIKGDRNVGKSCLLQRLQGGPFIEEYLPTDQIQVAPIHWKYRDTEHIIKVEVWEVVDKGRVKKKGPVGLKIDNAFSPSIEAMETPALDATFLDVYANANGVIMMMDITKTWTFEYVKREITTVPPDIPIILLGNHCDMHHHREINSYQIEMFISTVKQSRTGSLRYAETSMRNGFGLRLLHKFLNIPFLQLQRTTLINQLSVNNQEMNEAFHELDEFEKSEGADYESFLERLSSKRKQEMDSDTKNTIKIASDKSPSIVLGGGKPIIPPNVNPLSQTNIGVTLNKPVAEIISQMKPNIQLFQGKDVNKPLINDQKSLNPNQHTMLVKQNKPSGQGGIPAISLKPKDDIDDFCAGVLDHSFLDDMSPTSKISPAESKPPINYSNQIQVTRDSDSDGESGVNPLVVGVQDDLDSADEESNNVTTNIANLNIENAQFSSTNYSIHTSKAPMRPFDGSNLNYNQYNDKSPNSVYFDKESFKSEHDYQNNTFNNFDHYRTYGAGENDQYDSGAELARPAGYDSSPSWPLDTSIRRSPEGGEGSSPKTEIKKEKKSKEDKKHKKSKKSKDKDKERSATESDKSKDKEKKHKEKKHKKKDSVGDLEEFLNNSTPKDGLETYEVI